MKCWWGFNPNEKHSFTPKAWKFICQPKAIGGLGLRLTSSFNKTLLCKLSWQMMNGSISIWKSTLENKYLKNSSFLNIIPKVSDSWLWKGILKWRDLRCNACYQINNGTKTRVWNDPWIPTQIPFIPIPQSDTIPKDPSLVVSALTLEEPRRWNILLLQDLFHQDTVNEIKKIPLAQCNFHRRKDRLIWWIMPLGNSLLKLLM